MEMKTTEIKKENLKKMQEKVKKISWNIEQKDQKNRKYEGKMLREVESTIFNRSSRNREQRKKL